MHSFIRVLQLKIQLQQNQERIALLQKEMQRLLQATQQEREEQQRLLRQVQGELTV
ncbi:hypothetical protein K469DRAFT_52332 [Zopfia rhizophila CBS 207.26]|uniref:Uncharacterized protein n=1 Tax=Zopfia rhizophila CBS 207.26 TaxID=1314779 RepID=A0A6A6D8V7_9PEZI|nr:hypothetical protein K469DRAFT_52332 [Zopfia rhizophila CBS 207.26]